MPDLQGLSVEDLELLAAAASDYLSATTYLVARMDQGAGDGHRQLNQGIRDARQQLSEALANHTPSPVPQGLAADYDLEPKCACGARTGIHKRGHEDWICDTPRSPACEGDHFAANHTPAVPLSGSVEGQTDKDYADRKRSGSATDPSIPDEPTAADDFTMGDGSLADKMDQRAFVRGEGKYAANQHTPTQSTESVRGGWRAIESAPKDGTLVLIFDEKVDVYMASWINQSGLHPTPGWIDAEGDPCEPTHWMPLPSPPTTEPDPKAPRLGGEA